MFLTLIKSSLILLCKIECLQVIGAKIKGFKDTRIIALSLNYSRLYFHNCFSSRYCYGD